MKREADEKIEVRGDREQVMSKEVKFTYTDEGEKRQEWRGEKTKVKR